MIWVCILLGIFFGLVLLYAVILRGIIVEAINVADNYAPGGRDHIRIPYNLATRTVRHGAHRPHKSYSFTRGVHATKEHWS